VRSDADAPVGHAYLDRDNLISVTLAPPPKKYVVTHWSSRLSAQDLGVGYGTVGVARPRNPALARRGVQILHRSLTGRQGHRHRRALPGSPENAIVLPAARTGTSGPACRNNTSPPRTTPFPDVGDQLNESTPTDQHPHAVGGQTLCAGWAMNRPVCATCRSRRRPDKDVLALRADQRMRTTPRSA
jgi:hypothetical protein